MKVYENGVLVKPEDLSQVVLDYVNQMYIIKTNNISSMGWSWEQECELQHNQDIKRQKERETTNIY